MPAHPRRKRTDAGAKFLFAALLGLLVACTGSQTDAGSMDRVSVVRPSGTHAWTVELADTDAARSRGLMFRRSMDRDAGMLFRFEDTREVAMWMKNTFIPLDMVFIAPDGTIERVHTDAEPHSLTIISSGTPVRFVLELNAGEARRTGLAPGQVVRHPWMGADR